MPERVQRYSEAERAGQAANRLLEKIEHEPNSGCWLWTGNIQPLGYGMFYHEGRMRLAHRVSFELLGGKEIPEGLTLDHLCRERSCVNPDHLEPVELRENILRGYGPSAMAARQTECHNGHPLSGDNLIGWQLQRGHRVCRLCWRVTNAARMRRYRATRKMRETAHA